MRDRIYLSGKITGRAPEDYREQFAYAERYYKNGGFDVINPVTIGEMLPGKPTYNDYMKADLEALRTCTHIVMLEGWEESKGANKELKEAQKLGLEIIFFRKIQKHY